MECAEPQTRETSFANLRTLAIVRKRLDGQRQIDIAREQQVSRQHVQKVKKLAQDAGFRL